MVANAEQSFSLIQALMQPELYDPPVDQCTLIETHISWVILAGSHAYKIKKSLDLGFLDFSSLEKRLFYCQEELRLNKRLAPEIYLSVVPITGVTKHPEWDGEGEPIEYAVKMRAFPQQSQLDRILDAGQLQKSQLAAIAGHIAQFHALAPRSQKHDNFGTPKTIQEPVQENFLQIREHIRDPSLLQAIDRIEAWSDKRFDELYSVFTTRKNNGYIRECHGDLHLRNIGWVEGKPLVFDCIEFAPQLRWIDVISDVAFLVMDLEDRNHPELAYLFLNRYLEQTGDYAAMQILRYYIVYRAMVRAKVEAIRTDQPKANEKDKVDARESFLQYLQLAQRSLKPPAPQLVITRGMSASGKSTVSESLLGGLCAIRIRSDVERKRLYDLPPEADSKSAVGAGIYSENATEQTYCRLAELAEKVIDAGYPVIIDGVFLHPWQRKIFHDLACKKQIPYTILECRADRATLRQRIVQREKGVSDADLEVLEMQYANWQDLDTDERMHQITVDTTAQVDTEALLQQLNSLRK